MTMVSGVFVRRRTKTYEKEDDDLRFELLIADLSNGEDRGDEKNELEELSSSVRDGESLRSTNLNKILQRRVGASSDEFGDHSGVSGDVLPVLRVPRVASTVPYRLLESSLKLFVVDFLGVDLDLDRSDSIVEHRLIRRRSQCWRDSLRDSKLTATSLIIIATDPSIA